MESYHGDIAMGELDELHKAYAAAKAKASAAEAEALRASDEFVAAKQEANRLWRQIQEKRK